MQQSSIKSFFQSKNPVADRHANRPQVPEEPRSLSEIKPARISPKTKPKEDKIVIVLSDSENVERKELPAAVPKRRRLVVPEDHVDAQPRPLKTAHFSWLNSNNISSDMKTISEKSIINYLSKYGQLLKDAIHSRSLEALKRMLMGTLVKPKKPNQAWTKKLETYRCVNQDVDELITSWMRIFIRRKRLDINDDEVALLEEHRIRSAAEQKRDTQFIVDDSDDDEIPLCRVLVLEGPIGSGKTSTVHSCLYGLNEDTSGVIEVNVSQRRRQADLANRFKEATQSQWIGSTTAISKPKKPRKKPTKGSKGRHSAPVSGKHAVVLIDDVDVALEDDAGFFKGIAYLIKGTRRPIILTCAELPDSIRSLLSNGYYKFGLCDQNRSAMVSFLLSILISEGAVALPSDTDLRKCLEMLHCDLRSIINHLQFWLDVDRDQLITAIESQEMFSSLKAPNAYLYQLFSGFGNFSLEPIWKNTEYSNLESVVWHGIESELCNIIHENYLKLGCESDDDPRHVDCTADLANVAEGLSIGDLISSYQCPKRELELHQRMLWCSSGLIYEYYRNFICNSNRGMEIADCNLHSSVQWPDNCQFASIWEEFQFSEPISKHHPSSASFAVDHMSAIRLISRSEEQHKRQSTRRTTRRFHHYLRNTLTARGLELAEKHCTSLATTEERPES